MAIISEHEVEDLPCTVGVLCTRSEELAESEWWVGLDYAIVVDRRADRGDGENFILCRWVPEVAGPPGFGMGPHWQGGSLGEKGGPAGWVGDRPGWVGHHAQPQVPNSPPTPP